MNKMSKKMEYALMALQVINQKPEGILTSAKEISEKMHIPFEVTARVLQSLSSRGLLKAEYGVSGGYLLARSLHDVSVHELNEILEGHRGLTKCLAVDELCEISETCNIAAPVSALNNKINLFYKSIKLGEVLHV